MIYEFAVDPEALNTWERFRYVIEKFGVSKGRLISHFPDDWEEMVLKSYNEEKSVLNKNRILEKLKHIKELYYHTLRPYDGSKEWIENAIEQHNIKKFKAILTNKKNKENSDILSIDDLDENNKYFFSQTGYKVKRKAKELGECISSLLNVSKEIIFVDPHFAPDGGRNRYANTLEEFLKHIDQTKCQRIEYHLKKKSEKAYFEQTCDQRIKNRLPKGVEIKFVRLAEKGVTETLHARYILTDRGGVSVENGLDEGDGEDTTDINLLDNNLYNQRWSEYQKKTSPFEFVDEVIIKN